jgi:tetratricopeptide (TPR) repeat protein
LQALATFQKVIVINGIKLDLRVSGGMSDSHGSLQLRPSRRVHSARAHESALYPKPHMLYGKVMGKRLVNGTVVPKRCGRFLLVQFLLVTIVVLVSCSRDPVVRRQKYFQSGQRYFEKGKFREALIEFTNAVKVDPNYAEAHYQLAETYLHLQRGDLASQEFARTIELQPDNFTARVEMTNLLILSRNFADAQQQIFLLTQQKPNDPVVHSLESSLLAGQGNLQGAIDEMQKAIALDPARWESFLSLAVLQLQNNQPDAAEANLKKVTELNPQSVQAQLLLGDYYQAHGRFPEAEQRFQRAIDLDGRNPDPRAALARLYLAEGKKSEAETFLRQSKQDFPTNSAGYRLLGNFYLVTGELDKAVAEYASLLQEHPDDLRVKKDYIELLLEKSRFQDARKLNDEILKTNPNDNDALVYRSQIETSGGKFNDATAALETVIKNDPNNAEAHYVLGVAFEKLGNMERAEDEWRDAVRLRPDLLDAQRSLAGAAMWRGDMNTLENAATQIITLRPESPDGYGLRALSNINRGRLAAAEADVNKAIEVAPQNSFGYVQLGNLRAAQKRFGDAVKAYQQALDRNPGSGDALRGLMTAYIAQKQVDQAVAAANAQIARSPDNSKFYDLLGTVLYSNKKDSKGAQAALNKAIVLDPANSDAVIKLGQIEAASGEVDQAIALYEKFLNDHPRQAGLEVMLGQLYELQHDWKNAQRVYQNALTVNPQDPVASAHLANVLMQSGGNLDVALSLAQTARGELPDSPQVADILGEVYYFKGVYASAVSMLEEALKLSEKTKSENPDIHYHLGLAYQKTDQPVLARRHFEHVLKITPNYSGAADIRKQLAQLKS